jgi:hypothetical protein
MLRGPGRRMKCYSLVLEKLFQKERGRADGRCRSVRERKKQGREKQERKWNFTHPCFCDLE